MQSLIKQINWPTIGLLIVGANAGIVFSDWLGNYPERIVGITRSITLVLGICMINSPFKTREPSAPASDSTEGSSLSRSSLPGSSLPGETTHESQGV